MNCETKRKFNIKTNKKNLTEKMRLILQITVLHLGMGNKMFKVGFLRKHRNDISLIYLTFFIRSRYKYN